MAGRGVSRRRRRDYEPLGTAHVGTLLAEALGDPRRVREALGVWPAWEQVVGPEIAAAAQPASLRDGVLTLWVRNAVWVQELHAQRAQLLQRIRAVTAGADVRELRIRQAPRGLEVGAPAAAAPLTVLPAPVPYALAEEIRAVGSPALRAAMIRAASRWAGLQRARRG